MRGATGHSGDLLPLQTLHQGGLPVDGGGAIPLLAVVIVTPCKHLAGRHYSVSSSQDKSADLQIYCEQLSFIMTPQTAT